MKTLFCLVIVLLLSTRSGAETYSWVDETGTYNFSDDYNRVPKKYRKNIKRRGDDDSAPAIQKTPLPEKNETPVVKPARSADVDKQLYNGKTQAAWRKEFDVQEVELKRLELRLEQMQVMLNKPGQLPHERQTGIKEYDALRAEYKEKYAVYSDLIESARKAGLTVEIKKQ